MIAVAKKIELKLRVRVPNPLRKLYRLTRAISGTPQSSIGIPDHLLRDCRFCSSRFAMLDSLPRNARVAELGTFQGDFARAILDRMTPFELHLIDLDFNALDRSIMEDPCVSCHQGLTVQEIGLFPDDYFDFIYVDADHSYHAVLGDALACAKKIKSGGFLAFNDFCHVDTTFAQYGVHRAVSEFAVKHQWPFAFFAFQEAAIYDVALRKP